MAVNQSRLCLVCYDIADPRRLVRVHRYLRETGLPVQYSVFTLMMTRKQQSALVQGLKNLIDSREDDVRIYPLPQNGERINLGQQLFPEDVLLLTCSGNLLPCGNVLA